MRGVIKSIMIFWASQMACGKEPTCQCRRHKRQGFDHWVRRISWRTAWQFTPVFLFGESHGQRSLAGYSPRGHQRVRHNLETKQQQGFFGVLKVAALLLQ